MEYLINTDILDLYLFKDWVFLQKLEENPIGVFDQKLGRLNTMILIANEKTNDDFPLYHPFLYLLFRVLEREYYYEYSKLSNALDCGNTPIYNIDVFFELIAHYYGIKITIYQHKKYPEYTAIEETRSYGKGPICAFLKKSPYKWAFLIPDKNGKLGLISYKKCHTCWVWMKRDRKKVGEDRKLCFEEHLKQCHVCKCGHKYENGSAHPATCKKPNWHRTKMEGQCKNYEKSQDTDYMEHSQYFADFETFSEVKKKNGKDIGTKYQVYAAGLLTPKDSFTNETRIWAGPNALDDFMNYLLDEGDGILWFFNGSRFDCAFMVEWLVFNNVEIKSPIMDISSAVTFEFETNKRKGSKIIVKDLARFLQGSLDANCKAFKLDSDVSKTDFDHSLIKSWDDVEKYKIKYSSYLRLDVVALREIYRKYAKVVFDCFQVHICNFLTTSHLSYGAFSSNIDPKLIISIKKEDENNIRQSYRGGRVLCGRKRWISECFNRFVLRKQLLGDDFYISQEEYDELEDYLEYGDVNSLYPSVQVDRLYPVGNYIMKTLNDEESFQHCNAVNDQSEDLKPLFHKSILQVNVECPKNIMVAFLLTKKEGGGVQQDLNNKVEEWYTGPELWYAVQLGYKITKIHKMYIWADAKDIFSSFVKLLYKKKSEAERDTPIYTTMKLMMNGLTGKFAQHHFDTKAMLLTLCDDLEKKEYDRTITNVSMIFDEKGEPKTLLAKPDIEDYEFTPYPIQLSAFILGYSKIHMVKLLKDAGLMEEEEDAVIYSDTDSFILHKRAFDKILPNYKGKELGQLKKEVDGKIIGIVVMAPKTYNYVYIDRKSLKLKCAMRCKGIPHATQPYDLFGDFKIKGADYQKALKEHLSYYSSPKSELQPNVEFKYGKERLNRYVIIPNTPEMMELKQNQRGLFWLKKCKIQYKISFFDMLDMIEEKTKIECLYAQMKRVFIPKKTIEEIGVAPDYGIRSLWNELWWNHYERCYVSKEEEEQNKTAYPLGHEKLC